MKEIDVPSTSSSVCRQLLRLVYQIDQIRDQTLDAVHLLTQVANVLSTEVKPDLCLVACTRDDDETWIHAVNDRLGVIPVLPRQAILELLDQASRLDAITFLSSPDAFQSHGLTQIIAAPLNVLAARLGAFVLVNQQRVFTVDDQQIVEAVASQTDSALAHLRTMTEMQRRARELEAIYQIDRIRDRVQGAGDILPAVVNVVMQFLRPELCLLGLINEETAKIELREVQDTGGLFGSLGKEGTEELLNWALALSDARAGRRSLAGRGIDLQLAGAPLSVANERLGSLLLINRYQPFDRSHLALLRAIVSQADSAIVHARSENRLRQRNKELEVLYRVDQIRDQGHEFGDMLSAVLSELCSAIDAEMGFIMLFDFEGKQLELKASTADDLLSSADHYPLIQRAAQESLQHGALYAEENLSDWLHAVVCVPLILQERIIGVFGAVNRRGLGQFTVDDKRLLLAITSQVDTAIFETLDKLRLRTTFQRYVGPSVMEQMLATPEKDFLKGERSVLTVLFSDMRGFTRMSELVEVNTLVEMINTHLGAMTEVVLDHQGTLDKFVADEVMAIFGAPLPMESHALKAIRAALAMQAAQRELIACWETRGYCLPPIGIGINTGEMMVGNIGCEQQMDYTVLGDAVNLASRLCDAAFGGQILVSEETYRLVQKSVRANKLPRIKVKNKLEPVQVYEILGLIEPNGSETPR